MSKTTYFLIDYENVQPKNLSDLNGHSIKVLVFVGPNQRKVSIKVASELEPLGADSRCIQVSKSGKNALDFHIAFKLGELSKSEPNAVFHVISKDKGYDALLDHLRKQGFKVQRSKAIPQVPIPKTATPKADPAKLEKIVQNLISRNASKPRKKTTLLNTIKSLFEKSLKDSELTTLVEELERLGYIQIGEAEKVSYHLPDSNGSRKRSASAS